MPVQITRFLRRAVALAVAPLVLLPVAAAGQGGAAEASAASGGALLLVGQAVLVTLLLGLLVLAWRRGEKNPAENRGLGLPRGSVRSALALLIVGSTLNVLLFGAGVAGDAFGEVASTLGALSAAVVGFYFGGRTAAPPPAERRRSSGASAEGRGPMESK